MQNLTRATHAGTVRSLESLNRGSETRSFGIVKAVRHATAKCGRDFHASSLVDIVATFLELLSL